MARFTNYATIAYNGGTASSNIVEGEVLETLSITKRALAETYTAGCEVSYIVSLVNSGATDISGVTLTDDLGGYVFDEETLYPLAYTDNSLRYYRNGVLQSSPSVTSSAPLVITGISVPAGGSAIIAYGTTVTDYAPLGVEASVTNTVTATGGALTDSLSADATVNMKTSIELSIRKALSPVTVTENSSLTYTFVIENHGSTAADGSSRIVMSDTFNPVLDNISVTFNGNSWVLGEDYTYDGTTGLFETTEGKITVPAASYTQNADGTWTVTPGSATVVVTGTI